MCDTAFLMTFPEHVKYEPNANEKQGTHDPTGDAEFEVFRTSDYPDLNLWTEGWWWDLTPISSCSKALGPFDTSTQAYDHAMYLDAEGNGPVESAA
jgi:hypothetical protein